MVGMIVLLRFIDCCLLHSVCGMVSLLDCSVATTVCIVLIGMGIPVCIILLFLPAWYGRYASTHKHYFGSIPAKVAWILQECPSFLIPFLWILIYPAEAKTNYVNVICLAFYMFHYLYR